MKQYTVDASVALKWYLPEEHSVGADRLRQSDVRLHAPDYLWMECAAVLTRRVRRGRISPQNCAVILSALRKHSLIIWPATSLLDDAANASIEFGISLYDAIYLTLAMQTGGALVTADTRLMRALHGTRAAAHVQWIGALP